ncbi:ATPase, T2SS/T4P/T4SS family [Candidatus Omnitrophota bacterium]
MDKKQLHDFQFALIEVLLGKMHLFQEKGEREILVEDTIKELLVNNEFAYLKDFFVETESKVSFIKDFLSYDRVTDLLCDYQVEDIIINDLNPIYIHHSQKGFIRTENRFEYRRELDLFVKKLLLFAGRKTGGKIVNLELPNLEGRVNIAMSPFGPQITITKAKVTPLSIIDMIRAGSMTYDVAAQLWIYLEGMSIRPANILIAGGPGVGKTTLLNALFGFIPEKDRIVVIEDTLELNTFMEESCSRLESDDEVTLADLVKNSLRMRPERIVIGEVRGEEARDMITACNIGKYCLGTIHALSSREAIIRLQNEPMNIPEMLINLIDVIIVLKRYHVRDKMFRVIDEVSETSGMEQVKILLSHVFKYDYEKQEHEMVNPSTVFRDKLASQSGFTSREILLEQKLRALLLQELDKRDLSSLKEVALFCRAYNRNPNEATAQLGIDREALLNSR